MKLHFPSTTSLSLGQQHNTTMLYSGNTPKPAMHHREEYWPVTRKLEQYELQRRSAMSCSSSTTSWSLRPATHKPIHHAKVLQTTVQLNCSTIGFCSQILKLDWKKKQTIMIKQVTVVQWNKFLPSVSSELPKRLYIVHVKMFELGLMIMNTFPLLIFILKYKLFYLTCWHEASDISPSSGKHSRLSKYKSWKIGLNFPLQA